MNAERLHMVARAVADELASFDLVDLVGRLRSSLEALANNPSDAGAQQQVSGARNQLAGLAGAPSNTWPPTDRQILDELGISDILGERLLGRIEDILGRNEITPSVARDEIAPIHDRLTEVAHGLSQLLDGLAFFGISQDDLADEFEVGVAIPRGAEKNKLPELGVELVELQRILAPFEELAGEGRPDFEVRAIASSDFSVFLLAAPGIVLVLAQALNAIVDTYQKILDIKRVRTEMANLVPEDKLSDELVASSGLDDGRKNELRVEVKWSLNRIANRIDGGYSIDIRAPEPPEEPGVEEGGEDSEAARERARLLAIREFAATIRRLETPGKRILQLPESSDAS